MNTLDNDEIVQAFENILTIYTDHIGPYAIDIVKYLAKYYLRLS